MSDPQLLPAIQALVKVMGVDQPDWGQPLAQRMLHVDLIWPELYQALAAMLAVLDSPEQQAGEVVRVFMYLGANPLLWDEFEATTERLNKYWPELHDALQELACAWAEEG